MFNIISHERYNLKLQRDTSTHLLEMLKVKKTKSSKYWQGYGVNGSLLNLWVKEEISKKIVKNI